VRSVCTAVEAGARQQALSEFLSLIEGRDLLLTHADKQLTQMHRQIADKQASDARRLTLLARRLLVCPCVCRWTGWVKKK